VVNDGKGGTKPANKKLDMWQKWDQTAGQTEWQKNIQMDIASLQKKQQLFHTREDHGLNVNL